ncbi:MAG TPA: tRNA (adenosine(37)-N6)-dimethylallyltransferase MiaA [Dehalococcoidia bacterium]|nr:tRNA (adenosine(37)-N6)-dimethylallyltransferase MiaA [Dehalococcoidia bacterium]
MPPVSPGVRLQPDPSPRRLIAIVGPTASGKTALAIALAARLGVPCEAVNADSRQVYRYMDIGTAKPTPEERAALPHQLIDIVYPDEAFGLATWLDLANEALESAWGRGALPLLVGGTGQYVWALLEGWRVPKVPAQEDLRRQLEQRPPEDLLAELHRVDPESHEYIQPKNVRRVIRALEVFYATGVPFSHWRAKQPPQFDWLAIGVTLSREALYARIDSRVDDMFAAGFVEEVRRLREMGYARDLPPMSSIGYGEICAHLDGEISLAEAIKRTRTGTHRLARHQNAWFKRTDARIHWLAPGDVDAAVRLVGQGPRPGAEANS